MEGVLGAEQLDLPRPAQEAELARHVGEPSVHLRQLPVDPADPDQIGAHARPTHDATMNPRRTAEKSRRSLRRDGSPRHRQDMETSWRPAAVSMRNLSYFWGGLAAASAGVAAVDQEGSARARVLFVVALGAAAGAVVGATWSRRRFVRALRSPDHPRLRNWPPTADQQARSARVARQDAVRAVLLALVAGGLCGLVPLVGPVIAATGAAGVTGTLVVLRLVRGYERRNGATVLTAAPSSDAGRRDRRRRELVLGVVRAPRPA